MMSMCVCRLKKPIMNAYIWQGALLPPVKQMKELTWWRKKGENLSFLPALASSLISPSHYVYLCFWVCPSLSLAVKLSDGAGLSGIDHDRRLQALSTDGGVFDSATLHRDTAKPRPSIILSTWTIEEKCGKNRGERRVCERKHTAQQVYYHCHYLSLH